MQLWVGPASWSDARTKYFAEAVENGYAAGYYALGFCYYHGCGGDVDEVEAAKNFNLCAEKARGYGYVQPTTMQPTSWLTCT